MVMSLGFLVTERGATLCLFDVVGEYMIVTERLDVSVTLPNFHCLLCLLYCESLYTNRTMSPRTGNLSEDNHFGGRRMR